MSTFKKFYLEVLGKPPFKIDRKIYRIQEEVNGMLTPEERTNLILEKGKITI